MGTHTPGPWSFRSFEPDGPLDDSVCSTNRAAGGGDIVCLSPEHGGYNESAKRWEANARLIVAAPEMLEALEMVVADKAPSYHDCIDAGEPECAWCIARAAIAKATGATP